MGMNDLPFDISSNIFSRLDADSVLDCKLVCKPWLNLIKNPSFVQTHVAHHKLLLQTLDYACESVGLGFLLLEKIKDKPNDYKLRYVEYKVDAKNKKSYQMKNKTINVPPIKLKFCVDVAVVGSCNGLVCSSVRHDELYDPIHICNPVTREYVYLPRYEKLGFERVSAMAGGFGYCHSTGEYKVVRIYLKGIHCFFQVYRLGKESNCKWTEEKEIPELLVACIDHSKSVVVNGEIHWLDLDSRIVAFSLEDEEFRIIALPPPLARGSSSYHDKRTLCLLGDWLCLVHCISPSTGEGNKQHHVDIWSLKKHMQQNGTWFWSKEFSVQAESRNVIPLAISNNGKVLFWEGLRFISYDPKDGVREKLSWDHDDRAGLGRLSAYAATRHVNSFVSLKALGVKNCRRRLQYKGK